MGYEPKYKNKNKLEIQCPLRFNCPELGMECITDKCAWWLPIQKACAVQVNARKEW